MARKIADSFALVLLTITLLFFTPPAAQAQLFGASQDDPGWSAWKSSPNFPGIKIRVMCGTYVPSTGDAQWSFQFMNTYSKRVYLVYQEETADSTGNPPKFGASGGRNLGSDEKSDIYTDYLRGTCDSRKQIFIRVVRVSDDQGTQMQARAGTSRSGSFTSPPQSSAVSGSRSAGSPSGASGANAGVVSSSQSASPSAAPRAPAAPRTPRPGDSLAGSAWVCQIRSGQYEHDSTISFAGDGTATITDFSGFDKVEWRQNGTGVIITLGFSINYDLTGTIESGGSMRGGLTYARYPNAPHSDGSFACKLASTPN